MSLEAPGMIDEWVPVRFVHAPQICAFCQRAIPKGSPGSRTGERGTRAWWSKATGRWECLTCRTEGFRAEAARR